MKPTDYVRKQLFTYRAYIKCGGRDVRDSFRCLSCRYKEIGLELFAEIILSPNTWNIFFLVMSVLYLHREKQRT